MMTPLLDVPMHMLLRARLKLPQRLAANAEDLVQAAPFSSSRFFNEYPPCVGHNKSYCQRRQMHRLRHVSLRLPSPGKRDSAHARLLSARITKFMTIKKLTLEDLENNVPLPEILQAEWAKDQVADLAAGANVQHVQLKSATTDATVLLATAEAAFAADEAHAIQVRYVFEGEMWCDTIMPGNPTTKIIRNRVPNGC
jgi:hypothetical protein